MHLENVPGVSSVEVWGGADRQVQLLVNAAALAERGLTVTDVRNALRGRNRARREQRRTDKDR